jgi:hypothetical protein
MVIGGVPGIEQNATDQESGQNEEEVNTTPGKPKEQNGQGRENWLHGNSISSRRASQG